MNLGVLLVVLVRSGDAKSEPPPTVAVPASDARPGTQTPLPASASRMPRGTPSADAPTDPSVRSLADEAGLADPDIAASAESPLSVAGNVPEGPPLVRPIEAPAVAPATISAQTQPVQFAQEEILPSSDDLAASGTALPEMHLDIHVYSAKAADRFVFVNMRKYTEGQALKEGPTLERITTEGAVLNHRGLRFLLPRR